MTETKKELRCVDKVAGSWESRRADLEAILRKEAQGDWEGDDEHPPMNEYGLSFDYVPLGTFKDQKEAYFRFQVSYGGPSEELRIFGAGPRTKPSKLEWWYLHWFDGASLDVTRDAVARDVWAWFEGLIDWDEVQKEADEAFEENKRTGAATCPHCGDERNLVTMYPGEAEFEGECDACGRELVMDEDDVEED